MNLANKITMFRFFMVPVFMVSMYVLPSTSVIPLIIFALAAASDAVDGYVARKYNMVTTFGKFVDPLVDKILVLSAFVLMAEKNVIPGWIVVIVISRELIITGFRTIAADKGVTIAASNLGKIKTISQMLAIIVYFIYSITGNFYMIYQILVYIMAGATLISGYDYIIKNKSVLEG
ncbi:MAG: CDP-diacylglycerol--glycerol-3-phosphate 3-phosphatidyltransferase [Tissierellia bacterium]|jgi:CDP-diacylglycerol--glycerol-3-phosphate 3-phosphatidyltransferase|nr:CDP-diacylglycerol--glycerol-3-phosphate 3-phosphatidyltransferase [Tissierellia bacterium]